MQIQELKTENGSTFLAFVTSSSSNCLVLGAAISSKFPNLAFLRLYWTGTRPSAFMFFACVLSHFSHVWLCSPPGSSVHGILQARILEWVAMSCSRGSSWPWIEPMSLTSPASSLPLAPPGKPFTLIISFIRCVHMQWIIYFLEGGAGMYWQKVGSHGNKPYIIFCFTLVSPARTTSLN